MWVTGMTCKHLDYLTNYLYQTLVHYKPVKGSGEIDVDEIDDVYMYGSKKRADLREFRRGKGYGGEICLFEARVLMPNNKTIPPRGTI